jgi:hypothetical protein
VNRSYLTVHMPDAIANERWLVHSSAFGQPVDQLPSISSHLWASHLLPFATIMDIDQSSSEPDEDSINHSDRYFASFQRFRDTQESIEVSLRDQNSRVPQAAKELGNSVEGFARACDSFKTAGSAAIRNKEGSHELRGAAVKTMLSEWLDETTQETATLTAGPIDREISTLYQQQRQFLEELNKSAQVLADPWGNKMKVQAKKLKTLLDGEIFTQLSFSKRRAQEVQRTFPNVYTRVQTLVDETNALVSGHPNYANDSPWPQSQSYIPEGLPPPADKSMINAYEKDIQEVGTLLEKLGGDHSGFFDSKATQTASKAVLDSMNDSVNEISQALSDHLQAMHGY